MTTISIPTLVLFLSFFEIDFFNPTGFERSLVRTDNLLQGILGDLEIGAPNTQGRDMTRTT